MLNQSADLAAEVRGRAEGPAGEASAVDWGLEGKSPAAGGAERACAPEGERLRPSLSV